MDELKYKRVLLKISGESLCQKGGFGIDGASLEKTAELISGVNKLGCETAVVVGAGNFLRGPAFSEKSHIPRNTADYMGMLATVINACALQETLEKQGKSTAVLSAIEVRGMCEPFMRRNCIRYLQQGAITILAGGTGNPFFSTDTCAALRAAEIDAELIIKATKVDGVYTDDPMKNSDAKMIENITYLEVLSNGLKVIDPAAVSLCNENDIPIIVLNIFKAGNIEKALKGQKIGTIINSGT